MDSAPTPAKPAEARRHALEPLLEARDRLTPDELSIARAKRRFVTAMRRERASRKRHAA